MTAPHRSRVRRQPERVVRRPGSGSSDPAYWIRYFNDRANEPDPDEEATMTRLDKLRQKQGLPPRTAETPAPAAPPPPPTTDPVKPPKPTATVPKLIFACGHGVSVNELSGQPCAACRNRAKAERAARKRAAREAGPPKDTAQVGRLPAGSVKHLCWNGSAWHGTLDVPGCPTFSAEATGETSCLHALHALYAAWRAA